MTTKNLPTPLELDVLRTVSFAHLQKAVNALADGRLNVTLMAHADTEIHGRVQNGNGKEYRVLVIVGQTACDCADAIFRKDVCKHAAALALYAIRQLGARPAVETAAQPPDLRLVRTRKERR
jgi:uncharacterized Zn finger protein